MDFQGQTALWVGFGRHLGIRLEADVRPRCLRGPSTESGTVLFWSGFRAASEWDQGVLHTERNDNDYQQHILQSSMV